jgi:hypothetical protein
VRFSNDSGSVVFEFLGFGILLQLPILMFTTTLIGLQHDQFAAEAITRDALRSLVLLDKPPSETAAEVSWAYRVPISKVLMTVTCRPVDCQGGEGWIEITTRVGSAVAKGVIRE